MTRSRREFLQLAASGAAVAGAARALFGQQAPTGWDLVPHILARITPPRFADRAFDITSFGAREGADVTEVLGRAIAACTAAGPLIYAIDATNVAVTGRGTLDGQATEDLWWPWKGAWGGRPARPGQPNQLPARAKLGEMAETGVPVGDRVFGEGGYLRPSFIEPYRCQNVLIEGVTILNSPMWEIHPTLCRNVTVRDVTVRTHGPNNDGCNPESSSDVLIERCTFDTGDDCIALKSGRNAEGRRIGVPVENVIIRDCSMEDGHGGVVIGSEASGGARNIFAERCRMDSPQLDRALRFKTNSVRGGTIEHVYMRDVTVGQVAEAVVTANVRVVGCRFDGVADGDRLEGVRDLAFVNTRVNGVVRNERISR